jgi:hypothetical protein
MNKKMKQPFDISQLVDELEPVRPMNIRRALILPVGMTVAAIAVIATYAGIRADLMAGAPHPMFLLRAGTLLLMGLVCAATLLAMANPGVGSRAWLGAIYAALLFHWQRRSWPLRELRSSGTMQSGIQCHLRHRRLGDSHSDSIVAAPWGTGRAGKAGWLTALPQVG